MGDIAEACGVSKMTVSRVLRNAEYGVSESARERVLACAKRFNYRPNALAKSFAKNRSGYLGIALPFEGLLGSAYFSRLVAGLQEGMAGSDWQFALFDTLSDSFNKGDKLAGLYHEQRVDGLIAIAPHSNEEYIEKLTAEDIPVIIAGEPTQHQNAISVSTDDEDSIRFLSDYLIARGHREIGFVEGPENLLSARLRSDAFHQQMAKHGLPVNPNFIFRGDYNRSKTRDNALQFLKMKALPSAVIAANDLMALGFLDAANICGISVPATCSVVGVDDLDAAKSSYPPLTTMHQPVRKTGEIAMRCLIEWTETGKKPEPLKKLSSTIVERASVQAYPTHAS